MSSFGSILSGIGSVGSALGGALSNIIGNFQNQEWNRRNYELALRQQNFQEESFRKQMKFNSPVTQANLLRAANLNPALMNSGLAGSVSSGSSGSQPSVLPYESLDLSGMASLGSSLGLTGVQARNIESQTRKNELESKGLSIDNLFKKEDWISKIYGRDTQSWLNNQLADVAKLSFQYDKLSMKDRLKSLKLDVELKDASVAAQTISLQYLTPRCAAEINNLIAQQFVAYATGRSSLTQAHAAIMNATTNDAEMRAKFGDSPDERRKYSNAVYEGLLQNKYESQSREYSNITSSLKDIPWTDYHEYDKFKSRYKRR